MAWADEERFHGPFRLETDGVVLMSLPLGSEADTFTVSEIDVTLGPSPVKFMLAVSVTTTPVSVPCAGLNWLKVPRLVFHSAVAMPNDAVWMTLAGTSRFSSHST